MNNHKVNFENLEEQVCKNELVCLSPYYSNLVSCRHCNSKHDMKKIDNLNFKCSRCNKNDKLDALPWNLQTLHTICTM